MADERELGAKLDPLPDWQLFANVATQSELLDEVALAGTAHRGIAEATFDPAAVASETVPDPTSHLEAQLQTETSLTGTPSTIGNRAEPSRIIQPAQTRLEAMTVEPVDLSRPLRRNIFLRPLPTLADVEKGVEPEVRQIAPVGSEYRRGSIGKAIQG